MTTVLPAYVVIDESAAVRSCRAELAQGLISLCDQLRAEPMTSAKLRLCVLGMADDTRVRLPLSDMRALGGIGQPVIGGRASYASAFADLLARVPADVAALKAAGHRVQRPAVFFLTASPPDPDPSAVEWRLRRQLADRQVTSAAPEIITYAIGNSASAAAQAVASRPELAFAAAPGVPPGAAVTAFFSTVAENLISSGRLLGSATPQLVVTAPPHFVPAPAMPVMAAPAPGIPYGSGAPYGAAPQPAVSSTALGGAAATLRRLRRGLPRIPLRPRAAQPVPGVRPRRKVIAIAAGVAAVAAVASFLVVSAVTGGPAAPVAAIQQVQFRSALDSLAMQPVVHYQTTAGSGGSRDLQVTNTGDVVGTIIDSGQTFKLLDANGQFYVKPPASALSSLGAGQAAAWKGKWLTGKSAAQLAGWNPSLFPTPAVLSRQLVTALGQARVRGPAVIGGTPVLAAETAHGTLYVTKNAPYRIVSLVPGSGGSQATAAAGPPGPHVAAKFNRVAPIAAGSAALTFPDEKPSDVTAAVEEETSDASQASSAINTDISFHSVGNAQVSCSAGGCETTDTETTSVTGSAVRSASVNAVMNATFTIEGQPAGTCTASAALPANGTGSISCSDPAGGAVYQEVESSGATSGIIHMQAADEIYAIAQVVEAEFVNTVADKLAAEAESGASQALMEPTGLYQAGLDAAEAQAAANEAEKQAGQDGCTELSVYLRGAGSNYRACANIRQAKARAAKVKYQLEVAKVAAAEANGSDEVYRDFKSQIQKVVNYWDKTGRTPAGVTYGQMRGRAPGVFANDDGELPKQPSGYYRESDIWPNGGKDRGKYRLVFGKKGEVYYSNDHYRTFTELR